MADPLFGCSIDNNAAFVKKYNALAQIADRRHIVAYKYDCPSFLGNFPHFSHAFLLKLGIAHGEDFIYDENFRFQMCGNCEAKAHEHTA